MRILIVANYNDKNGGISGQVTLLAKHLREDGFDVEIFSTKASPIKRISFFSSLEKTARDYDVIHVHCCSYLGFYPAILACHVAKKLNKRLVLTYHGGGGEKFFKKWDWAVRRYMNATDENIVLSGFLAEIFKKFGYKYRIIPNILGQKDEIRFRRSDVNPKFISVRSHEPIYNIECILRAFKIVKDSLPEATLDVLADGSLRKKLEQYVIDENIKDVKFVGKVPNSEIGEYLQRNDIFISMPRIDNQPMSVLEAWRYGLLVISSNVGGVPYLVDDNKAGILVPSDDSESLAKAMIQAVEESDKSLSIMRNGTENLKEYSWSNIRNKIMSVYS